MFKTVFQQFISQGFIGVFGVPVSDQFSGLHQPQTPNITQAFKLLLQFLKSLPQLPPPLGSVFDQPRLNGFNGGKRRRARNRIAAESRTVSTPAP